MSARPCSTPGSRPGGSPRRFQAGAPTGFVSEPLSSLILACKALEVRRLGVVSPYVEQVSARLREAIERAGISVAAFGSFNEASEARVARISRRSIEEAARTLCGSAQPDAVFLSCTNLRTLDVIGEIEAKIGKPVLSSNTVLAWHMCKLAGVEIGVSGYGRLLA